MNVCIFRHYGSSAFKPCKTKYHTTTNHLIGLVLEKNYERKSWVEGNSHPDRISGACEQPEGWILSAIILCRCFGMHVYQAKNPRIFNEQKYI